MARHEPPSDGLKQALGNALADRRKRRDRRGNPKQAKQPKKPKLSLAEQAAERTMVAQVVTPEARRHGDYHPVDFKLQEVTEGGKRKEKTIRVVRNLSTTVIERWIAKDQLNDRQIAAVLFYQEAFRKVFGSGARITANYSGMSFRGGSTELWLASEQNAKLSLMLLDEQVFRKLPPHYHPVFQNVVIWDEAAGVAGSRAGYVNKPAEAVAKEIVRTVAHMIADVVIDKRKGE